MRASFEELFKFRCALSLMVSTRHFTLAEFLRELHQYGLTEKLLTSTFHCVVAEESIPWRIKGIPNIGFYRAIHPYLKSRHPRLTKVVIGKFYVAIDHNLKEKGSGRPDNVYRFIEGVTN